MVSIVDKLELSTRIATAQTHAQKIETMIQSLDAEIAALTTDLSTMFKNESEPASRQLIEQRFNELRALRERFTP